MKNEVMAHTETEAEKAARAAKLADFEARHPESEETKEVREMLAKAPNLLAALDGINEIKARYDGMDKDATIEALRREIEELSAELRRERERRRWIPVSKILPLRNREALVYLSCGEQDVCSLRFESWPSGKLRWHPNANYSWRLDEVTHWMPLPEPPTTGEPSSAGAPEAEGEKET